jgi:hypothetical protein
MHVEVQSIIIISNICFKKLILLRDLPCHFAYEDLLKWKYLGRALFLMHQLLQLEEQIVEFAVA